MDSIREFLIGPLGHIFRFFFKAFFGAFFVCAGIQLFDLYQFFQDW